MKPELRRVIDEMKVKLEAQVAAAKAKAKASNEAEVVELYPPPLTEEQLMRRQQAIDATWWVHLRWEAEQRRNAPTTCHKGPGDSDWGQ